MSEQPVTSPAIPTKPPGVRMDFSDTLKHAWNIFKKSWFKLTILAIPSMIVGIAGGAIAFLLIAERVSSGFFFDVPYLFDLITMSQIWIILPFAIALLILSYWFNAAASVLAAHTAQAKPCSIGTALKISSKAVGRVLLFSFLWLLCLAPFYALVVVSAGVICVGQLVSNAFSFGVYILTAKLCMVLFVLTLENRGVFQSVKRSFKLTDKNLWRIVGITLLLALPFSFLLIICIIPLIVFFVTDVFSAVPYVIAGVCALFSLALGAAMSFSVYGAIYVNRKDYEETHGEIE